MICRVCFLLKLGKLQKKVPPMTTKLDGGGGLDLSGRTASGGNLLAASLQISVIFTLMNEIYLIR